MMPTLSAIIPRRLASRRRKSPGWARRRGFEPGLPDWPRPSTPVEGFVLHALQPSPPSNIFVTSPSNAFSIRRKMMAFRHRSGLDRALHREGPRLNTLSSFAKATHAVGLQGIVREPKDHSDIRSSTSPAKSHRADTGCQSVNTTPGVLVQAQDKLSKRILFCLVTEVLNCISVQRCFVQPH